MSSSKTRLPCASILPVTSINEPGLTSKIRVPATCCLFFKIPPGDTKCGNCSLMTPEERIRELKQDMAEAH
ncbi:(2Fe-2S)-binding protein [Gloeocapsopsis crepidinum LEGE 06123]|uniref:(2Fe-2S)-binding protein n=1 Tax=Gloeocapsopsis crepidinum LEGE 06123 TaxID=588587 RepID=A0ABR9UZI4_9CHRO|nr:(2Fe-2S)-binding protein [Gloeocapsopsis crepidinum LEGE 06123]